MIHSPRMPLRVVRDNLISNGIKLHDHAEERVAVTLTMLNRAAECRISDDGPGIQLDGVAGNNAGITIAKKTTEACGGRTRVESAPPERGMTVDFTGKESPR